jgi:competence protein ComEA
MKLTSRNAFISKSCEGIKGFLIAISLSLAIAVVPQTFAESINRASQETLQNIKGVGPSKAKKIITERERGGNFQDASDLRQRVKGIGEKTIGKLGQAGITFSEVAPASSVKDSDPVNAKPEKRIRSRSRQTQ